MGREMEASKFGLLGCSFPTPSTEHLVDMSSTLRFISSLKTYFRHLSPSFPTYINLWEWQVAKLIYILPPRLKVSPKWNLECKGCTNKPSALPAYNMNHFAFVLFPGPKLWLALCTPMDCSAPDFPVLHYLLEFIQTHVHWVGDAIQPSHLLSPPSAPALNLSQHQGLLQWVGSSHQVVKVMELQL